jgi:hypothetical protein
MESPSEKDSSALSEKTSVAIREISDQLVVEGIRVLLEKMVNFSAWLLIITGGAFAALVSSGQIKFHMHWESKALLIFLLVSAVCGCFLKWWCDLRNITLLAPSTQFDVTEIHEAIEREGEGETDPQKRSQKAAVVISASYIHNWENRCASLFTRTALTND